MEARGRWRGAGLGPRRRDSTAAHRVEEPLGERVGLDVGEQDVAPLHRVDLQRADRLGLRTVRRPGVSEEVGREEGRDEGEEGGRAGSLAEDEGWEGDICGAAMAAAGPRTSASIFSIAFSKASESDFAALK